MKESSIPTVSVNLENLYYLSWLSFLSVHGSLVGDPPSCDRWLPLTTVKCVGSSVLEGLVELSKQWPRC